MHSNNFQGLGNVKSNPLSYACVYVSHVTTMICCVPGVCERMMLGLLPYQLTVKLGLSSASCFLLQGLKTDFKRYDHLAVLTVEEQVCEPWISYFVLGWLPVGINATAN